MQVYIIKKSYLHIILYIYPQALNDYIYKDYIKHKKKKSTENQLSISYPIIESVNQLSTKMN